MSHADLGQSLQHYRELAPRYDRRTRFIDTIRLRAIEALGLAPGETVLDAGCGTGWSFPHISARVGPKGRIVGFDPSPEMLAVAATRVGTDGTPVDLLRTTAEDVVLPTAADAVLFSYTHDLINSRPALDNLLRQVKPGARVAATSTKLYASWLVPANWYLRVTHRGYITNFESFEAPWALLATYLDDFRVDTGPFTQHYVATGRVRK